MQYTGRIVASSLVFIINSIYIAYYFLQDGSIRLIELIGFPIMVSLAWFFGKQYDKAKWYLVKLKESNADLNSLYNNSASFLWSSDINKQKNTVSKGMEQLYGYTAEEFEEKYDLWITTVHEDDREKVNHYYQELLSGKSARCEWRLIHKNGEERWLAALGNPLFNHEGQLVKLNGVARDITYRKQMEEKLHTMAFYDHLTGLPNRNLLHEQITQSLSQSKQTQRKIAIMLLDLDRFKIINDTLGHTFGDLLLKEVSNRMSRFITDHSIVSRYGGDEFIIFQENASYYEASSLAEDIIREFSDPIFVNGKPFFISTSIGISLYPLNGDSSDILIKNADAAMYAAKENGGNGYQFYNSTLDEKNKKIMRIESGLREALENREFTLVYQPQVHLDSGHIVGAEALLRWESPEYGFISPADFIPVAEKTGLIVQIGEWVLETACKQNKKWQQEGFPPIPIAVNVSGYQLQQSHFLSLVKRLLEDLDLDPAYLEIEITESVVQNKEQAIQQLHELKALGVKISVDDFGTGYSSLSYLQHLPIDKLKIDKSFVDDITQNSSGRAIVQTIINMGNNLSFNVTAEGIEDEQQVAFLKENHCYFGQGYYFHRPLSVEEMTRMMGKGVSSVLVEM
ncbi:putative bifunctional diguanylate cyclase/phosphodiesterase [Niallia oryzisoli]|uniref:putative bifunctional diguanylate cyclase/phosphodiesterase n=1 Tax=Niallia oryzisoli TaxID=1737571 RepID=UPI0037366EE5